MKGFPRYRRIRKRTQLTVGPQNDRQYESDEALPAVQHNLLWKSIFSTMFLDLMCSWLHIETFPSSRMFQPRDLIHSCSSSP